MAFVKHVCSPYATGESRIGGLIIVQALYGKLVDDSDASTEDSPIV